MGSRIRVRVVCVEAKSVTTHQTFVWARHISFTFSLRMLFNQVLDFLPFSFFLILLKGQKNLIKPLETSMLIFSLLTLQILISLRTSKHRSPAGERWC